MKSTVDIPISEWEKLIDEWVFSERDRLILKRRLLDGKSYKELESEFNLTTERLKQIIYKAQKRLFKKIK